MMKRFFDVFLAGGLLLLLSPVLLLLVILIRLKLGSPVFFTQERPGYRGKLFKLVKFRSMTDSRDSQGNLLPDVDRLPPFGQWLRASSLDELPELWNILKGDMNFVGPRPLLVEYLNLYSEEELRRHDVRPGLTGWAQINGRNQLSWKEKFALDLWYVDNQSFWLDLKILWQTAFWVLKREGVSKEGHATTEKYNGSN